MASCPEAQSSCRTDASVESEEGALAADFCHMNIREWGSCCFLHGPTKDSLSFYTLKKK